MLHVYFNYFRKTACAINTDNLFIILMVENEHCDKVFDYCNSLHIKQRFALREMLHAFFCRLLIFFQNQLF